VLAELGPRVAPEGAPGPGARQVGLRQGMLSAGAVPPQAVQDAAAEGAPGSSALELDQLLTVPGLRKGLVNKGGFKKGYRGGVKRVQWHCRPYRRQLLKGHLRVWHLSSISCLRSLRFDTVVLNKTLVKKRRLPKTCTKVAHSNNCSRTLDKEKEKGAKTGKHTLALLNWIRMQ
jgi:hypothetical protein